MKFNKDWKRLRSILTNGVDTISIECNRYGCSVTPPRGGTISFDYYGNYYINGKLAHIEIVEEKDVSED